MRQERNIFGFGRSKAPANRKCAPAKGWNLGKLKRTIQDAHNAGDRLGDTGLFEEWLCSVGLQTKGPTIRRKLHVAFDKGVSGTPLTPKEALEPELEPKDEKEKEQADELKEDVINALLGQGMSRPAAKAAVQRAYRKGDNFEELFRRVLQKRFPESNPGAQIDPRRLERIAGKWIDRTHVVFESWPGKGRMKGESFIATDDTRVIRAPRPTSLNSLFILLHEAGHHYYRHTDQENGSDPVKDEWEATNFALRILRDEGFDVSEIEAEEKLRIPEYAEHGGVLKNPGPETFHLNPEKSDTFMLNPSKELGPRKGEDERDYLRRIQDELIRLAEAAGYTDDVRISDEYPGSPTIGELKRYVHPQWKTAIEQTIVDLRRRRGNPSRKDPAEMTAGEINKALDRLDKQSSILTDKFIEAGRGNERPSEYLRMSDPLAMEARRIHEERVPLQIEIEMRYGPGAPARLPKGFGPRHRNPQGLRWETITRDANYHYTTARASRPYGGAYYDITRQLWVGYVGYGGKRKANTFTGLGQAKSWVESHVSGGDMNPMRIENFRLKHGVNLGTQIGVHGNIAGTFRRVIAGTPVLIMRMGGEGKGSKDRRLIKAEWEGKTHYGWVDKDDLELANPRGGRFDRCVSDVSRRGGVDSPYAVCQASVGRGNPGKWILPFKRGKKNYENVGALPFAIEIDIGFSGDKMYRPVKVQPDGNITIASNELHSVEYDRYSRKSAIKAAKELQRRSGGQSNPGKTIKTIHDRGLTGTIHQLGGKGFRAVVDAEGQFIDETFESLGGAERWVRMTLHSLAGKNPRTRKTKDEFQLWGNYGYGWDELTAEDSRKEINQRLKEYRENSPEGSYKIKVVRVPIGSAGYNNPMPKRSKGFNVVVTNVGEVGHDLTYREAKLLYNTYIDRSKSGHGRVAGESVVLMDGAGEIVEEYQGTLSDESNPESEQRELELFVENDADLYRQMYTPINKNLATKKARGVYNHSLAVKGFGHLIEAGAKKYAKEFGGTWHQMFSVADRKAVAERFTDHFETEYDLGNYDNLLPKKYQKKNSRRRRHNPEDEAARMYEQFHGRPPEEIVETNWQEHEHSVTWSLGDLVELEGTNVYGKKWHILINEKGDPQLSKREDRVLLTANEEGTQLFFDGGDQEIDLKACGLKDADIKEQTLVGVLEMVTYQTVKGFHKFKLTDYYHELGEESDVQPLLVYAPKTPSMHVVGGQYKIEAAGIIN